MKVLAELQQRSRYIIGPVLGVSLFIYFLYHAVQGDRGLIAYWQLANQVEQAVYTSNKLDHKVTNLRHRVSLLSPRTLDPDMLDERARFMLGYARPSEIVIFLN